MDSIESIIYSLLRHFGKIKYYELNIKLNKNISGPEILLIKSKRY